MIEWFDSHTRERGEPRTHGSCGEELSLHTCEVAARQCLQNLAPRFDAISEVCTMSVPSVCSVSSMRKSLSIREYLLNCDAARRRATGCGSSSPSLRASGIAR